MSASHITQEDTGKLVLEDGSGHLVQEESVGTDPTPTTATQSNSRQRAAAAALMTKRRRRNRRR